MQQADELQVNDKVLVINNKYEGMQGTVHMMGYGRFFVLVETEGRSKPGFAYEPGLYPFGHNELQKIATEDEASEGIE